MVREKYVRAVPHRIDRINTGYIHGNTKAHVFEYNEEYDEYISLCKTYGFGYGDVEIIEEPIMKRDYICKRCLDKYLKIDFEEE